MRWQEPVRLSPLLPALSMLQGGGVWVPSNPARECLQARVGASEPFNRGRRVTERDPRAAKGRSQARRERRRPRTSTIDRVATREHSTDAPEIVHAFGKCVQITSRVEPPCTESLLDLSAYLRHEGVVGILLDRSSAAAGKTHDKTNENPKLNPYVLGVSLLCGTFRKEYGKKSALAAPNPCRNDVFDVAFVSESGNSCMQIADCGHDPRFV